MKQDETSGFILKTDSAPLAVLSPCPQSPEKLVLEGNFEGSFPPNRDWHLLCLFLEAEET